MMIAGDEMRPGRRGGEGEPGMLTLDWFARPTCHGCVLLLLFDVPVDPGVIVIVGRLMLFLKIFVIIVDIISHYFVIIITL